MTCCTAWGPQKRFDCVGLQCNLMQVGSLQQRAQARQTTGLRAPFAAQTFSSLPAKASRVMRVVCLAFTSISILTV